MGLKPFQKGIISQTQRSTGGLKPFVPKIPKIQQRPDIKQNQNYLNAVSNAKKYQQESQQLGSIRGLTSNTLKGVGNTVFNMGKEVVRMPLTIPLKVTQSLTEGFTGKPQVYTPQTGIEKFFYGDQTRQSYQQDQRGIEKWGQEKGFGRGSSIALGAAGAGAEILADLLPAGVGGKVISKVKALKPFQKAIGSVQKGVQTQALETPILGVRRTLQKDVPAATKEFSKVSSYTPIQSQVEKNFNLMEQFKKLPYSEQKDIMKKAGIEFKISNNPLSKGQEIRVGSIGERDTKISQYLKKQNSIKTPIESPLIQEARKSVSKAKVKRLFEGGEYVKTNDGYGNTYFQVKGKLPDEYLTHGIKENPLGTAKRNMADVAGKADTKLDISEQAMWKGFKGKKVLKFSDGSVVQKQYVDEILSKYPNAKPFTNGDLKNTPIVFKEGDNVVGLTMPIADAEIEGATKFIPKQVKSQPLQEADPLIQEAKKYKSAEEFIKAQTKPHYINIEDIKSSFDADTFSTLKGIPRNQNINLINEYKSKVKRVEKSPIGREITKPISINFNLDGGNGYRIIDGNHRYLQALKNGDKRILAKFYPHKGISQEGKNIFQEKTKSQLTDIWNKSQPLQEGVSPTILANKAEQIINPANIIGKERGHIEKIANSPELSNEIGKRLRQNQESFIKTRHQEPLVKEAQRIIFENPQEAERIAISEMSDRATIMADELTKHFDALAIQAKKSGDIVGFENAMQKAVDISLRGSSNLTDTARALNAAKRIDVMSPNGIIDYVNKVVKEVGGDGVKISNEKYYDIIRKAESVKNIIDPKQKALATFDLIDDIYSEIPTSLQNKVSQALNLPRAIMATADLSAPLRQGIFSAARNPKTFAKNFGKMFKYAFSEDAYRGLKADILTSPNYSLYVKHKLPLTDISNQLTGREEQFMSQWAELIPGFGKIAKGSNRAYSGFLNKMRMDLFDDFVKTAKSEGITDAKFFDDASKFVGSATGRGRLLDVLEPHAGILNGIFFSPRLMASRINLINPIYYTKLHPAVRKEALKTLASFVGTGMSILGLAKLNGAEVGTDPRSADFGKIKMGNTRYDIWGGFQQYARLIGQLTTGEKISTTTGKETQLGSGGFNAPTRESIFIDFLKSKTNPLTSFAIRASQGEQFGEKFNLPAEVIDRFIPMIAQDAFDLSKEYGLAQGIGMAIPGAFGVGSMTYGDQIPMLTKTSIGNPSVKWRSQPSLGETILNSITGKQISSIPKDQWRPLLKERTAEQKRQVEVNAAKQDVLNTGQPKYVGDTFIFLDNGVVKTKVITPVKRTPLLNEVKKQPFYGN